jgi:predicted CXXCH cytochrome family protein
MNSNAKGAWLVWICIGAAGVSLAAERKSLPPMVPHGKFSQDCSQCHVPKNWTTMRPDFKFDHAKETGFPLRGAHVYARCTQCHNDRGPVKKFSARGCAGCHPDPHNASLGMNCEKCHTEISWRPSNSIADHSQTAFPLTGAHIAVDCQRCHARAALRDYKGASIQCFSCHQTDYRRAPNHVRFNYPPTCGDCHSTSSFSTARMNHNFLPNVVDCYSCHQKDYQAAPQHLAFNFPRTCGDCHTTTTFSSPRFNHGFLSTTAACYSCHAAQYATAPNHVAQNFSTLCYNCHMTTTWKQTP